MQALRIHRLRKQEPDEEAERARVNALLADYTEYVREQMLLFFRSVRDPATLAEVETALAEGRVLDAFDIIDQYVVRLGDRIVEPVAEIGRQEAEALVVRSGMAGAGVGVSFNPTAPEITDAMRRNQLEFIVGFSDEQRQTVNQALTAATEQGLGPAQTARMIRDTIGLTPYQQGIVDRYRSVLQANSRDALDYALRDRRYDRGVENAVAAEEVLSPERIDLMVDRYRERFLQLRAETIARTEGGRIAEESRNASVYQSLERAGIDSGLVAKQWMSTDDERRRDTHEAMQGQARLLEDDFDSPSGATLAYPHDSDAPAAEVISCRCTVAYHIFATQAEVTAFLLENGQGKYDDELADEE